MHIDDASSIDDHINKAVAQDFFLAKAAPLPAELDESIEFISTTPACKLHSFWDAQLKRMADYVALTSGARRIFGDATPPEIKSATGTMRSVATSALLGNYDMGGASWMGRFAYGVPLAGDLSHEGVSPRGAAHEPGSP